MTKRIWISGVAVVAIAALSWTAFAQVTKGKTRAASTKRLMSGVVLPNCGAAGKTLKEAPPTDDNGWEVLATNVAVLNEVGHLLMDDGRCPDGNWANAAKTLREGSAATLAKIEAKDLDGAKAEFEKTTQACAACHKAHKK